MASSSVCVSSPWNELVVCLSTSVCLRFQLRNDFDFVLAASGISPSASVRLFKHTCSIIWLRIPWQCTLALDLVTFFPDCDHRPLESSTESNIMVICWGHCCKLILQQTSHRRINHCWTGYFKVARKILCACKKFYFHLWNFWRRLHPCDKQGFPYKHLILCVAISLWCHIWHLFQAQRHYLQL